MRAKKLQLVLYYAVNKYRLLLFFLNTRLYLVSPHVGIHAKCSCSVYGVVALSTIDLETETYSAKALILSSSSISNVLLLLYNKD